MGVLGRCIVCSRDSDVIYPLLSGSPSYCSKHAPPDEEPDDFDIPLWDETSWNEFPVFREPILRRRAFVWTDKDGNEHKLKDIDDYYLCNIINFLRRKDDEGTFGRTIRFLDKEVQLRLKERNG